MITPNALCESDAVKLLERLEDDRFTLIYFDPPWPAGKDRMVVEWDRMVPFDEHVAYMAAAFYHARRLLVDDGYIACHADHLLAPYVRLLLDDIFGPGSYKAEYIILYHDTPLRKRQHSRLILYAKGLDTEVAHLYRPISAERASRRFPLFDENGPYRLEALTRSGERPSFRFPVRGKVPPNGTSWRFTSERMLQLDKEGKISWFSLTSRPMLKRYLAEESEEEVDTIWDDLDVPSEGQRRMNIGQQSLVMLDRLLQLTTEEEDWVLDPFCGTGTTMIACARSHRNWIGGDVNSTVIEVASKRIRQEAPGDAFEYWNRDRVSGLEGRSLDINLKRPSLPTQIQPEVLRFGQILPYEESLRFEFKEVKGQNPTKSISNAVEEYVIAFLNSAGGHIFWGVRNEDRMVVGVALSFQQRDEVRRLVTEKIGAIMPAVPEDAYALTFYKVSGGAPADDLYVVHIEVTERAYPNLFFKEGGDTYIKTDAGKRLIRGPALETLIRNRLSALKAGQD